jgi:alcohol dehydrogenase class IV
VTTPARKTVIFSPHLLAKVAILDPELTVSMPPRVTAATGFDALTHCIEAYLSQGDHPMADAIALGGIELVAKHLPRAVEAGADLVARGAMMKAAMMGAVAFQKGLGVCHSLAHPLSSEKGLHHGLANALCLPAVVDFNNAAVPDRVERIRRLVDMTATSLSNGLRGLRERIGLPGGLSAEGVKKEDIKKLADKATEDACWKLNPRAVTREDMVKLYELSL